MCDTFLEAMIYIIIIKQLPKIEIWRESNMQTQMLVK